MRALALIAIGCAALAACGSAATSQQAASAPSTTLPKPALDAHAAQVCRPELHGFRLDSTHLAAGYDSTAGATVAAAERRGLPVGLSPLAKLPPTKPVIICWYTDATFTSPAGRGAPSKSDGAVVVYVDNQPRVTQSITGPPERPR